jgi:DNA processing protein
MAPGSESLNAAAAAAIVMWEALGRIERLPLYSLHGEGRGMTTVKYWVWLASLRGLTTRAERLVLEYFENPMEAYFCEYGEYARMEGLTNKDRKLLASKNLDRAESILALCEEKNIRIMTMQDADYPQRLAHIYDPPAVLYVRGRIPVIDEEPAVAVVGTRKASAYGLKMATRLGYEVTKGGGLVISGLAAGVDARARAAR